MIPDIERVCDLLDEYHRLGAAEVDDRRYAVFLRSDDAPTRYDGNHVRRLRLKDADAVQGLLAEMDRHYAHLHYRSLRIDPLTTPPAVEARLLLDGWTCNAEVVLGTDGPPAGRRADVEIASVEDEDGWTALTELIRADHGQDETLPEVMAMHRRRCPPFTFYIARWDGRPVGYFSQRTRDGLGYLEHLFVLPEYRLRGVATALVHHTAARARDAGADYIFLPAAAEDTPKEMYARMGFRPLLVFRNYLKRLDD